MDDFDNNSDSKLYEKYMPRCCGQSTGCVTTVQERSGEKFLVFTCFECGSFTGYPALRLPIELYDEISDQIANAKTILPN